MIAIVLITASCKKLIEIPDNPRNQLPISRVFSDSADIMAAVAGVYANFGISSGNDAQFASGAITIYTALTGDELMPGGDIYNAPAFYQNNLLPDDQNVASIWSNAYAIIFQINTCIAGITNTTVISSALQQQLLGELEFDRAFLYFNMINIWGGVPIITATDYKVTANIPRALEDSVYDFILSDLSDAQQKLTPKYPSNGHIRPNLYAAQALLSKVYLYRNQYQNALDAANEVINSGKYNLEKNLNNVFLDGSAEALWQLPANSIYQATPEATAFIPYDESYESNYVIAPTLINAFESGDKRKKSWIKYNTPFDPHDTLYYAYKYKNLYPDQTPVEDYMMLRLADIYLIKAEAEAQLGNLTKALEDLNKIRTRAKLANSNASSQQDIINAILHERQTELFCEWGNRWFDLKRTKTIDAVLGAEKTTWKPMAALFPIPTPELQSNSHLMQNPGY